MSACEEISATMSAGSQYLNLAEKIIDARGIPLTGAEIISFAENYNALPYENYETIVKTLQARIAEEILSNRGHSRFIRTGVGKYFLRNLHRQSHPWIRERNFNYLGRRAKPEHPYRILIIPRSLASKVDAIVDWASASALFAEASYSYQSEIPEGSVPVVTAPMLKWNELFFSFSVGAHTHFNPIISKRTALLRKFLDEYDLDLFEVDGSGATSSTARAVLPVLLNGRRHRLEHGKLMPEEKIYFYQVADLLSNRFAFYSAETDAFVMVSLLDISKYS
ncbi:conserved domain protein [Rhodobacter capsulatus SB 1003]|uniref:Conserved domain protein n=2 Tax=Rhodobacter capsulatus TaxID=1061 RepID=D5APT8_RHOCB|nr:conserved domain protein [Rhodobacter capsulatus SB 1003]